MAPKKNNKGKKARDSPARSASPPAKKGRKTREPNPVEEKIAQIVQCIQDNHDDGNESVKSLLVDAARNAFTKPIEERHEVVTPFIDMVEKTVVGFCNLAANEEQEAQDKVKENVVFKETLEQEQAELNEKITQNTAAREAKKEELEGKEAVHDEKEGVKLQLDEESEEQLRPLNEANKVLESMQLQVEVIKELHPQHELDDAALKKKVAVLVLKLKEANAPSSLLISAPCSIRKRERSTFDLTVINQISETFDKFIQEQISKITSLNEGNRELVQQVQNATGEYTAALESRDIAQNELDELKAEKKKLDDDLKAKNAQIKKHDKQITTDEKVSEGKTSFKNSLLEVHEAILFLRERTDIVKETPVEEPTAVAFEQMEVEVQEVAAH